ncbi:hypothetical protein LPW11_04545 [Geomonas sp. RF6]|uniref:hypothetical protein n=1 Tax=Geomonas sp. RF6 TaxID=2897342 RepID=UPI001E4F9B76|nr:hypothetical protein [Geomonas sp. RF6]UFS71469.1 hypothetical protein LPW11_04545 [Geomonas sp. RF6]
MRKILVTVSILLISTLLLLLSGCGGGGGGGGATTIGTPAAALTSVGWYIENNAPDYNSGTTSSMIVTLYYDSALATSDIDGFTVTAPAGTRWTSAATASQFGTSSNGKPFISRRLVYGSNKQSFPLAGIWTFTLTLKDGTTATIQRTFHEPGSAADATHAYVYTAADWTPTTNASDYVASLARFPSEGYIVEYSPDNDGMITTRGLAEVTAAYLAAEPRAYNMYCWLYDANNSYLGHSALQYSQVNHSPTGLVTPQGELAIVPALTTASAGTVDLSKVKYLRFVYTDGAQYAPASYSQIDYHSVSSLVAVQTASALGGFIDVAQSALLQVQPGL